MGVMESVDGQAAVQDSGDYDLEPLRAGFDTDFGGHTDRFSIVVERRAARDGHRQAAAGECLGVFDFVYLFEE